MTIRPAVPPHPGHRPPAPGPALVAQGSQPDGLRELRTPTTSVTSAISRQAPQCWTAGRCGRSGRGTGYPARDLAWDVKVGITTIARLEQRPRGPRRCRIRTLARLAATLGEPPAALVPVGLVAILGLEPVPQPGPAPEPDVPDQTAAPDEPAALSA